MQLRSEVFFVIAALLLGVLPYVAAHGGEGEDMLMGDYMAELGELSEHKALSYFRHPDHWSWHLAHTISMSLAWTICMPLAIFLSVARSRYHLPAQILFHIVNGLGVLAGFVYNHSTPDLYMNNAHHPLGWVVVAFTIAWTLLSVYVAYGEYQSGRRSSLQQERGRTIRTMARFEPQPPYNDECSPRDSRDSGQGTERNSASLFGSRQNSTDDVYRKPAEDDRDLGFEDEKLDDEEPERRGFLGNKKLGSLLSKGVRKVSTKRTTMIMRVTQILLEKFLLLLGFAALTSGFIVAGGLFRDRQIFSGLAHYIKGGIFVWYGLLTLGRWMGAFTEYGWAWNVRPQYPLVSKWKSMVPSAEFTESFVIWLYGTTNVFLEHMSNWGKGWSSSDLEHLSITILFVGGGLLGMLIESKWAQELMNTTVLDQKSISREKSRSAALRADQEAEEQCWEEPGTYRTPLNPMPASTIMAVGMMMSGHHQTSMVSTMMHGQWGGLFSAFAFARGVTYITMYLKPSTSHFPSRPPSEVVAAFCLTSGGILFMNSAADVVWAIESNGLDAMTIFTLTLGLTGIILAWEVVLFALKGWAVRKERATAGRPLA